MELGAPKPIVLSISFSMGYDDINLTIPHRNNTQMGFNPDFNEMRVFDLPCFTKLKHHQFRLILPSSLLFPGSKWQANIGHSVWMDIASRRLDSSVIIKLEFPAKQTGRVGKKRLQPNHWAGYYIVKGGIYKKREPWFFYSLSVSKLRPNSNLCKVCKVIR